MKINEQGRSDPCIREGSLSVPTFPGGTQPRASQALSWHPQGPEGRAITTTLGSLLGGVLRGALELPGPVVPHMRQPIGARLSLSVSIPGYTGHQQTDAERKFNSPLNPALPLRRQQQQHNGQKAPSVAAGMLGRREGEGTVREGSSAVECVTEKHL